MNSAATLHLASSSPRRKDLLQTLGLDFTVQRVAIDESPLANEAPLALVLRLAAAKASAAETETHDSRPVLGADTVVVLGNRILGKPRDVDDALDMLLSLSAREHTVLTGIALKTPNAMHVSHSSTNVVFREITRDEALCYWQSGEPCDKAGAYGIQGLGGLFVERISGSYSGVVGLPVFETAELLKTAGIDVIVNGK